jgi:hypothetical protein
LTESEKEKNPKITELAAVVSVMVSILVAATSLLSNSGNLPPWWFDFSLILLIALTFFMPTMIFAKPIKGRIRKVRLDRKRDSVSRKHALEFKEQVANFRRYGYDFKNIVDNLRSHYAENIKSQLITHILQQESQNGNEINNSLFSMEKEIEESNKTYPSIYLLAKRFEYILTSFQKSLKVIEVFVHEMASNAGKPVSKGIEKDYESFRERYNDFLNDFGKFCHKMNQEAECRDFPEYSFSHLEKW